MLYIKVYKPLQNKLIKLKYYTVKKFLIIKLYKKIAAE